MQLFKTVIVAHTAPNTMNAKNKLCYLALAFQKYGHFKTEAGFAKIFKNVSQYTYNSHLTACCSGMTLCDLMARTASCALVLCSLGYLASLRANVA